MKNLEAIKIVKKLVDDKVQFGDIPVNFYEEVIELLRHIWREEKSLLK